jgi:hypothetical protein
MQRCSFSETQFVFQYVFEHYQKHPFSPMPFFPDTVNEGKYYGFDVCIGNLFLQFKVANQFEATDAKSKKTTQFWNAFKTNNYQIGIKASDQQFLLLKKIASHTRYQNSVFYVVPCFHTKKALMGFYNAKKVTTNAAHFKITSFPKNLKGQHKLVYTDSSTYGVLFSDPVELTFSKNVLEDYLTPYSESISLRDIAYDIRDAISEVNHNIADQLGFPDKELPQQLVQRVYAVLLNEFNIHWFPLIDDKKLSEYE